MEAVKPVVQRLGGSIVDGWLTFGEYDVLVICQLPDNVSATALSMAISAGGAVKSVKTTPLVTFDEGLEALKKAKEAGYTPPPSARRMLTLPYRPIIVSLECLSNQATGALLEVDWGSNATPIHTSPQQRG